MLGVLEDDMEGIGGCLGKGEKSEASMNAVMLLKSSRREVGGSRRL
jgi:hypothetical protein